MLLSAVAETGLSETIDDGCAALLIVVLFWDIVIFTFERFSRSVFALALDYADAARGFNAGAENVSCQAGLLISRQVLHDCGQGR